MAASVEEIGAAAPQALELHALQHLGELRSTFESGRTRPLAWRQSQLRGLLRLLAEKEEEAFRALHDDLGKHRAEAYRDEVFPLVFFLICTVAVDSHRRRPPCRRPFRSH
jgi:aldehyde dehydrogenase (NAD+)